MRGDNGAAYGGNTSTAGSAFVVANRTRKLLVTGSELRHANEATSPVLKQVGKLIRGKRVAVKIFLRLVATHVPNKIQLLLSLLSLGDGGQPEGTGQTLRPSGSFGARSSLSLVTSAAKSSCSAPSVISISRPAAGRRPDST